MDELQSQIIADAVNLWFGPNNTLQHGFAQNDDVDAEVCRRFGPAVEQGLAGKYRHWQETPEGCTALIVLLDQFTRSMYRNTAKAYAGDSTALQVASHAVAKGRDKQAPWPRRAFFYLPFGRDEQLQNQRLVMELMEQWYADAPAAQRPVAAQLLQWAKSQRNTVIRFGRFPARNQLLKRATTPAERNYLDQEALRRATDPEKVEL